MKKILYFSHNISLKDNSVVQNPVILIGLEINKSIIGTTKTSNFSQRKPGSSPSISIINSNILVNNPFYKIKTGDFVYIFSTSEENVDFITNFDEKIEEEWLKFQTIYKSNEITNKSFLKTFSGVISECNNKYKDHHIEFNIDSHDSFLEIARIELGIF